MTELTEREIGLPYGTVPAKRSWDVVPAQIDWHNYLASRWNPGRAVDVGTAIRPLRAAATGLEYVCTVAGVSAQKEPRWPTATAQTVTDGTVTWQSQPRSTQSRRAGIVSVVWEGPGGITLSGDSVADDVATTLVGGGEDGEDYELVCHITLANGERKEGVVIMPVRDEEKPPE